MMRSATGFAIAAALLAAVDTLLVKLLSQQLHAFEIAFFRSLFGLALVMPWLAFSRQPLRSSRLPAHFLRAVIKYAAMAAFFIAVANAPVSDVTAIALTAPVLSVMGAWLILRERRSARDIGAVLLGLAGALIIAQPGLPQSNPYLLLALGGAAGLSSVMLLLKHITTDDSAEAVVCWNLLFTTLIAAIPAWFVWTAPGPATLAMLVAQGGLSSLGILMMARAAGSGAISHIAALDFLRLPVSAALAVALLGESVHAAVWIGGCCIIASSLLSGMRRT